jgi:hypothetical protein
MRTVIVRVHSTNLTPLRCEYAQNGFDDGGLADAGTHA